MHMAAFKQFRGALTGRISVAAARSASVILGTSRQAPAQTSSFLGVPVRENKGLAVCFV